MKVISSQNKPIKMWLDDLEQGALDQAKNLANLPFTFKHVAIMPDSHHGYGMPIGSILATKGVVVPNAVGVDIGCGMCSVGTDIPNYIRDEIDWDKLNTRIRELIPVGRNSHEQPPSLDAHEMPQDRSMLRPHHIIRNDWNKARHQVGTLGGGNHFIEVQAGSDGRMWIMIHSGSRNLGHKTATHYNNLAKEISKKYYSSVPPSWDLAFLPINSEEGRDYMAECEYATAFALANRSQMMLMVQTALNEIIGTNIQYDGIINKPHNFVAWENHFGENVVVHRKGACRARDGEIGMIPGSQGAPSYIVSGKGEKQSFESCSHGAGRLMSRRRAKEELSLKDEQARLEAMGVYHTVHEVGDLDEAPSSYKDILKVMANQTDLVDVLVELQPLMVVKG